ncbi:MULTISPECIES: helix-turn-helix domain-containing protein [Psychrobacter]|uniref:helix-turn-helix domain-containing protein n=1 Tax=Psychrobacter TaxID=497 RepID=UPI001919C3AE|nr:helix-turn-helix transcriptional regulator [Psychrobacter glacincola]
MKIGKTLKNYRQSYNFTQVKLAEYADLNEKYYGQIERNECSPTIEVLGRICDALDITMSDFFRTHEGKAK